MGCTVSSGDDFGERIQKSYFMSASPRCVPGRRFRGWMKSGNLISSRINNAGMLLPSRS
jgi:hypothetical protein